MLAEPFIMLHAFDLELFDLGEIAEIFAENTENSDLLLLSGKVGAGKTEFARLFIKANAKKENIEIEEVSSPTFSLIQSYEFKCRKISHIDLYRVKSELELLELGIPDVFDSQITILEWPEILEKENLPRYVRIKILETKKLKKYRNVEVAFFGDGWDDLIGALIGSRYFNK